MREFDQILSLDVEERLCTAESGVTFEQLVRATLPHGLIPMTVPELRHITIGGAVSGCSVESMSFKYGGFHDSCTAYEVVTGTGEVLEVTPEEKGEIFQALHNSFGTLGLITKLTFRLIAAKPFVKMTYVVEQNMEEYWALLTREMERGVYDFIDGIVVGPSQFVACLGELVDEVPYESVYSQEKIFYQSVTERTNDYMALEEYFFRYDRDCHWLTKTFWPLTLGPVRRSLGRFFLGSTNLIKWSKRVRHLLMLKRRPEVVVDVFIPAGRAVEFYEWYAKTFDFYPLWVVPYRYPSPYPFIADGFAQGMGEERLIVDFAIYGKPNSERDRDYSRLLEEKVYELNGVKTLISRNHYTEERFWEIYSKPRYEAAKRITDPHGFFESLYPKMHKRR